MKILRGLVACAFAFALAGCAAPADLLEQNAAGIPPTAAKQILIILDGKIFGAPLFGTEGHAYLTGLGQGLQSALVGIPTTVVVVDPMMMANPVPPALQATRPSHTIRVFTVSDTQRNGFPISAVWQMDVADMTMTAIPAADGKPSGTRFTSKPVYKARAEGDTCLVSDSQATQCGASMGKFLGETLRTAHAVLFDGGS